MGQTSDWEGPFPSEAVIISGIDYKQLLGQYGIRDITREEYEARPVRIDIKSPGVTLQTSVPSSGGGSVPSSGPASADSRDDSPNVGMAHLLSPASVQARVKRAAALFASVQNQQDIYRTIYERLPTALLRSAPGAPAEVASRALPELRKANLELARLAARPHPTALRTKVRAKNQSVPASSFSRDCTGDEDYATTFRQDASKPSSYSAPSVLGLIANFDFPLKNLLTCVKNQGNRGTCGAFSLTGALEIEIAQTTGRFVNLSEQDLYSHAKNIWQVDEYMDGLFPGDVWGGPAPGIYKQPKESMWVYNPSWNRSHDPSAADPDQGPYLDSCKSYVPSAEDCARKSATAATQCEAARVQYAKNCSNTSHQAPLKCSDNVPDWEGKIHRACGFGGPIRTGDAFAVSGGAEAWDASDLEGSLDRLVALSRAGKPVVIGVWTTDSFGSPLPGGYIAYKDAQEPHLGAHAILIVGYLSNEEIAANPKVAPWTPLASGRGYFIIKNSWGPQYADGGYVYMPTDWLKAYGLVASFLTGNVTQE